MIAGPAATSVGVLRRIFAARYARTFAVRLWDGTTIGPDEPVAFTLVVNAPSALRAAFLPPIDLNPGRAFAAGLIDIEGDIVAAVDTIARALGARAKGLPAVAWRSFKRFSRGRDPMAASTTCRRHAPISTPASRACPRAS